MATAGRFSRPVRRLGWYAEYTLRCEPVISLVPDLEECFRRVNAVDRNGGGDGEPFRLGLAQGRLQAEASSLELSVPVIPIPRLPLAIGCREMVRGLRGLGG